jgi:uncharacterized protein DUF3105
MRGLLVAFAVAGAACVASDDDDPTAADASSSGATTMMATTMMATTSSSSSDPDSSTGEPGCAIADPAPFTMVEGCGMLGESFCSEGQMHVEQGSVIEWMHDPPHSGPHYPTWETWDEHTEVVPRGNWVHNLEHGGIVLSYRCDGDCEPEVALLRDAMNQRPELRILVTADPFLPGPERFAAISWTWVFRFDPPIVADLLCFADQHENHAPEDIP